MQYSIKYFDGQKSNAHEATAQLRDHQLYIDYINENNVHTTVIWQVPKVRKNQWTGFKSIVFEYGDFPQQSIQVDEHAALGPALLEIMHANKSALGMFYYKISNSGLRGVVLSAMLFVICGLLLYFYAFPFFAEKIAAQIPIEYEIKMGRQIYENMILPKEQDLISSDKSPKVDSVLSMRVNEFAKKINFSSPYPINVTVVDDKIVNAFALPGGNIIIYTGLLHKIKTSSELAGLLGHEVSHINKRHSLKNLARSLSGYLFITILTSDINGLTTVFIDQAHQLNSLSYSRALETEADIEGINILKNNKIDAMGMYSLMQTLKTAQSHTVDIPGFLSTHPLTEDRMTYIKKHAKNITFNTHTDLEVIWRQIKHI